MHKFTKIIIFGFVILSSSAVMAETAVNTTIKNEEKTPVKTELKTTSENHVENKLQKTESTFNLYASPEDNSKIISTLPANANLVAIYQKGEWMKVGDRQNGDTGWINVSQYHQARQNFYRHFFQTNVNSVYINTAKDKDGKTVIEAYQNGKKLSDADAKKLYEQMQSQEKKQMEAMQHFNQVMDQQMRTDFVNARREMDDAFQMMPGIVIVQQPVNSVKK